MTAAATARPPAATGPNRRAKEAEVADLAARLRGAALVALADYQGITVEEATRLRRVMRRAGGRFVVHKNTLIRLAAKEAGLDGLEGSLAGNTGVATAEGDPVAVAKALVEFANDVERFRVKAAVLEGAAIPLARLKELADLPSREVLIARLIGAIQAPLRGIASIAAAPLRGLATVVKKASEKIETQAGG